MFFFVSCFLLSEKGTRFESQTTGPLADLLGDYQDRVNVEGLAAPWESSNFSQVKIACCCAQAVMELTPPEFTNMTGWKHPNFQYGNTSTQLVDFPASHVSFRGCIPTVFQRYPDPWNLEMDSWHGWHIPTPWCQKMFGTEMSASKLRLPGYLVWKGPDSGPFWLIPTSFWGEPKRKEKNQLVGSDGF